MPASDPITAVANAATAARGIAGPIIAEAEAQKYENERIARVNVWADAAAGGDPARMHAVCDELLASAGQPVAVRSTSVIWIGVEYLDAFARLAADTIKLRQQLNSIAAAFVKK